MPEGTGAQRRAGSRLASRLLIACALLLVIGAGAIRIAAWNERPSFWVDELRLANNVAERSLPRLLSEPMLYRYLVPPGWLALERSAFLVGGRDERWLRLASLLAALAAVAAMPWLARRVLGRELALPAAAAVGFGAPLIYYANDLRPYAADLLFGVLLPALALRWRDTPDRARATALAIGLAVAPLFSFGACLGGLGVLFALAFDALIGRRRSALRFLGATAAATALTTFASAGIPWLTARGDAVGMAGLRRFWTSVGGFVPAGAGLGGAATWLVGRVGEMLRFPFRPLTTSWPAWLLVGVAILGGWALGRRDRLAAALVVGPFAVSITMALLRAYPLATRLTLFLAPGAALLLVAPFTPLERLWRARPWVGVALGLVLAAPFAVAARGLEQGEALQSGRELVKELAERIRPGDRVYVLYSGEPAWRFYAPVAGLAAERARAGRCRTWTPAGDFPPSSLPPAGSRQWLFLSNAFPEERDLLAAHLERVARPLERFDRTAGRGRIESLELYEFGGGETRPEAEGDASASELKIARWRCVFFED